MDMRTVGDKVHSHNSNYIYSIAKSNGDSIEFSLLITEQKVVGLIPAWSLAFLHILPKRMNGKLPSKLAIELLNGQ